MKNHKHIEQGTDEWHQLRKGKITGTTLKSIMGTPRARQEALYELVSQRLKLGLDDDEENAMQRGVRLESEAASAFEFETELETERTGFSQSEDNPFIANSPDRWIKDANGVDLTEGVEIKCPEGKNYVKIWLTNKIPDDYYWQMIQYFVVNEKLLKMHFVAFNPDIPAHPLHIIEMLRRDVEKDIETARSEQDKFLKEVEEILSGIISIEEI